MLGIAMADHALSLRKETFHLRYGDSGDTNSRNLCGGFMEGFLKMKDHRQPIVAALR